MMKRFVRIKFQKFYVEKEGAFSYYPKSEHATLDGSGFIGDLKDFGYCSAENQIKLWGDTESICKDKGIYKVTGLSDTDFNLDINNINSVRIYTVAPKSSEYTDHVLGYFILKIPRSLTRWNWYQRCCPG